MARSSFAPAACALVLSCVPAQNTVGGAPASHAAQPIIHGELCNESTEPTAVAILVDATLGG
jgi:hypothetical protein